MQTLFRGSNRPNVDVKIIESRDLFCISSVHRSGMPFGEVVIGPPGSGKSTYAFGKQQLFAALKRPICVVNLDPANDNIPYPCTISISSLITLQEVMDTHGLGPNGGMLYCMEYLKKILTGWKRSWHSVQKTSTLCLIYRDRSNSGPIMRVLNES